MAQSATREAAVPKPSLVASDLSLIGIGVSCNVLVAAVLAIIHLRLHVAVWAFMGWVVIPFGALFCGVLSGLGYELAARVIGKRPGKLATAGIAVGGLVTFVLIYVFEYLLADVNGIPLSSLMSLASFANTSLRETTVRLHGRTVSGELGVAGIALAVVNLLGCWIGGLLVYAMPGMSRLSCDQCGRYMR